MIQSKLRALGLFDDYVGLTADARARMREDLAQRDPQLLAALLSLVAASQVPSLLDMPAIDMATRWLDRRESIQAPADDHRVGTRLGPWRISRVVAEGGMGTIYEAHRDDGQYEQRAALKFIRSRLTSPTLVSAFLTERRHLAGLDHPGIATLLDGGVDADGQPWFAMRFVDGVAIDQWCDTHLLDLRGRVRLLCRVCDAVAYAHARGVLHRDLKPSNLLVTEDGRVQLVDFGISSALTHDTAAAEPQIAISRDYTAPEVLAGGAHGVAGDVYAMGAVMYRILCSRLPTPDHGVRSLLPAVWTDQPESLVSLVLLAAAASDEEARQRGVADSVALARALAGDLSAIAAAATAVNPEDRYPSVRALGEDLQRWLDRRPLEVRSGERFYRLGKFVHRHRLALSFTTALMVVSVGALGIVSWQRERALQEARATEAVAHLFANTLGSATLAGLGSAPFSSETLLRKTELELRKLTLKEHPVLQARGLAVLARSHAVIGHYQHAQALAAEAQQVLGDRPDESGYIRATHLSLLNTQAKYSQAEQLAQQWIEEIGAHSGRRDRLTRAAFLGQLAVAQWGQRQPRAALSTLDSAFMEVRSDGAENAELMAQLLIERSKLSLQLFKHQDAIAEAKRAISLATPSNPVLADDGREQLLLIMFRTAGKIDVADAERLLAGRRNTLGDRHPKTGMAWIHLGTAQYLAHKTVEAKTLSATGEALILAAYGRNHPAYADALSRKSYIASRDSRDNLKPLREALDIYQRTLGPEHDSTLRAKDRLAARLNDLPPPLQRPGDFAEIRDLYESNLRIKRRLNLPAPWENLYLGLAWMRHGGGDGLDRAQDLLMKSRVDADLYFSPEDRYPLILEAIWAQLRYLRNEREWADREFARISEKHRNRAGFVSAVTFHSAMTHRAAYALGDCRKADAERFLVDAYQRDVTTMGEDNFLTKDALTYLESLRKKGILYTRDTSSMLYPALADTNRRAKSCRRH